MKISFSILLFVMLSHAPIFTQAVDNSIINKPSTGWIYVSNGIKGFISGTGFVFIRPNTVVTCAHVVKGWSKIIYIQSGTKNEYLLDLVYIDTLLDIAILTSIDTISNKPYEFDATHFVAVGDTIMYIGYSKEKSTKSSPKMGYDLAVVQSAGKTMRYVPVNFFEFKGEGKPGYSGGPILDPKGNIVGIFQGMWEECSLNSGDVWLKNRGFLLDGVLVHLK